MAGATAQAAARPMKNAEKPKEKTPPILYLVGLIVLVGVCGLLITRTNDTRKSSSASSAASVRDEAAACSVMADRKFNMNIPLGDIKSAAINGDASMSTVRITTTDGAVKWNIVCDMMKNSDGNWAGINVVRR